MSESERDLPPEGEPGAEVEATAAAPEAPEVVEPASDAPIRRAPVWPAVLAVLALLAVIAGWIIGGFAWQRFDADLIELQRADAVRADRAAARIDAAEVEIARLEREMTAHNASRERERALLEEGLRGLREQIAQDAGHWVVAEVEYLLQIAHQRLRLARDVAGADFALAAADERLRQLADPDLLPVRELIADERNALRAVPEVDIDGLALALRSLARRVDQLPAGGNRYRPGMDGARSGEAGGRDTSNWQAIVQGLWNEIKGLVQVRRDERVLEPLPSFGQEYFLYLNLRIQLDAARLALLRGSQGLYTESLQSAREWLEGHFNRDHNATRAMLNEIDRLQGVQIVPELPDLSGSLRALRSSRARGAGS